MKNNAFHTYLAPPVFPSLSSSPLLLPFFSPYSPLILPLFSPSLPSPPAAKGTQNLSSTRPWLALY